MDSLCLISLGKEFQTLTAWQLAIVSEEAIPKYHEEIVSPFDIIFLRIWIQIIFLLAIFQDILFLE